MLDSDISSYYILCIWLNPANFPPSVSVCLSVCLYYKKPPGKAPPISCALIKFLLKSKRSSFVTVYHHSLYFCIYLYLGLDGYLKTAINLCLPLFSLCLSIYPAFTLFLHKSCLYFCLCRLCLCLSLFYISSFLTLLFISHSFTFLLFLFLLSFLSFSQSFLVLPTPDSFLFLAHVINSCTWTE